MSLAECSGCGDAPHAGQCEQDVWEKNNAIWQADFDGPDYDRGFDHPRLSRQIDRVYGLMKDHQWRTLSEIEDVTNDSVASISARLRDLRKQKFGGYIVDKRIRGFREDGLYEYQVNDPRSIDIYL